MNKMTKVFFNILVNVVHDERRMIHNLVSQKRSEVYEEMCENNDLVSRADGRNFRVRTKRNQCYGGMDLIDHTVTDLTELLRTGSANGVHRAKHKRCAFHVS